MGGSFESGAGDDPDKLFGDEDEPKEDSAAEVEIEKVTEATTTETASDAADVMFDTPGEIEAAQLAREFIPDAYNKTHAWALGRNGVNDGRSEKKTFFLQSSVLDLEATCSEKVDEILDGHVPLTDLRELALILAYHQPELLAEAAREWGAESA